jgi:hypothetical protein
MHVLPVRSEPVVGPVPDPEVSYVKALVRLYDLQIAALTGGPYDPDAYDAAIIAYRRARAAAEAARAACAPRWATPEPHAAVS